MPQVFEITDETNFDLGSSTAATAALSAATLRLLRPGLLSEPEPLDLSWELSERIEMTPTADTAFGAIFKSFAHPDLVARGKSPRNAWTLNGEPVAIETVWRAIQELCLAVLDEMDNTKEIQKARSSIRSMGRVKCVERHLRKVLSAEVKFSLSKFRSG
ncbi:hypothetical protein HK102_012919, partial [Quaeritorhiza haematococci]